MNGNTGMLGAPAETYKTSNATPILIAVLGLLIPGMVFLSADPTELTSSDAVFAFIFLVPTGFLVAWLFSVRVTLHQDGIAYRSLFGSKEMRWDEVERFYYSSVKRSINFIPVGTYYTFKFVGSRGQSMSFGNRVERPDQLGKKLIEYTYVPLLQKAARLFDSGSELDFGPIRVSKATGVKIKKWFRHKSIPWEQVADYRIDQGHFYVWRVGQKHGTGHALGKIPNAFVLLGLLDTIYKTEPEAG